MRINRFFVIEDQVVGKKIIFDKDQSVKISKVLRLRKEDIVECFDSNNIYEVRLSLVKKESIEGEIVNSILIEEKAEIYNPKVIVLQSLPKNIKPEMMIQKSTELGVFEIILFSSERSVVKANKIGSSKVARWKKVAIESSLQSGRYIVPSIRVLNSFSEAVNEFAKYSKEKNTEKFICQISKDSKILLDFRNILKKSNKVIVLIGPEGGFSEKEITEAKKLGFIDIVLAKNVLRSETASITFLSQLNLLTYISS